jgi:hypothetical protein
MVWAEKKQTNNTELVAIDRLSKLTPIFPTTKDTLNYTDYRVKKLVDSYYGKEQWLNFHITIAGILS